jgi:hypothetical protein
MYLHLHVLHIHICIHIHIYVLYWILCIYIVSNNLFYLQIKTITLFWSLKNIPGFNTTPLESLRSENYGCFLGYLYLGMMVIVGPHHQISKSIPFLYRYSYTMFYHSLSLLNFQHTIDSDLPLKILDSSRDCGGLCLAPPSEAHATNQVFVHRW